MFLFPRHAGRLRELMAEPFWRANIEERAVTLVRTERRVRSADEFKAGFAVAFGALKPIDPDTHRVLVDLRLAIGRNDSAFEATVAEPRRRLLTTCTETALLVATQVGAMQVRRHLLSDGLDLPVFTNESDARDWLKRRDAPSAPA